MRTPTVVQYDRMAVAFVVALAHALALVIWMAVPEISVTLSALFVLAAVCAWRVLARFTVNRHHRRGMRLVKRERFTEAAEAFRQSIGFWERHPVLDRFRFLALLSPTLYAYLEMGRCNLAFSLAMVGQKDEAVKIYRQVREMNPDNGLAVAALRLAEEAESPMDVPEGESRDV